MGKSLREGKSGSRTSTVGTTPIWIRCLWIFPAALALGAYLPAIRFGLVWDDITLLKELLPLHKSIWDAFTHEGMPAHSVFYYRPLLFLSLMFDRSIWGDNPVGFHAAMIGFHLLTTLLVYGVSMKLLAEEPRRRWMALAAASLFALHPGHTEVVAWISARPDSLLALFALASFYCHLHYRERNKKIWLLASSFSFFLALLAKETAVVFFFCLLLYDLLLVPPPRKFLHHAGYLILIALYFLLRQEALGKAMAVPAQEASLSGTMTQGISLAGLYLQKTVFPFSIDTYITQIPDSYFLLGTVFCAALIPWTFFLHRMEKRLASFLILFFFVTLLPPLSLSFFGVAKTIAAERYLYLPSFAFCLLAGLFFGRKRREALRGIFFLAVAGGFGFVTVQSSQAWRDDLTFWEKTVKKNPEEGMVLRNLAVAHQWLKNSEQAFHYYERVLKAKRSNPEERAVALTGLGTLHYERKEYDLAEARFQKALEEYPYELAVCNLGTVYYQRFLEEEEKTKALIEKAIRLFENCLQAGPRDPAFWRGRLETARRDLKNL